MRVAVLVGEGPSGTVISSMSGCRVGTGAGSGLGTTSAGHRAGLPCSPVSPLTMD